MAMTSYFDAKIGSAAVARGTHPTLSCAHLIIFIYYDHKVSI